jgi:fatty acid desaturase
MMKKILRYPEDRWPLAYTLMVLAVQLGLFFGVESLRVTALCVVLFQPVQAVAIACNHYQHHINVFNVRGLNRAYEVILFLQTGTPPYLITLVARLGYDQHAGLDLDDHLNASRNIESRFYNLVTFNSGYHTAHHVKPGLHWSKLPEFHRQIRDGIPAELR